MLGWNGPKASHCAVLAPFVQLKQTKPVLIYTVHPTFLASKTDMAAKRPIKFQETTLNWPLQTPSTITTLKTSSFIVAGASASPCPSPHGRMSPTFLHSRCGLVKRLLRHKTTIHERMERPPGRAGTRAGVSARQHVTRGEQTCPIFAHAHLHRFPLSNSPGTKGWTIKEN